MLRATLIVSDANDLRPPKTAPWRGIRRAGVVRYRRGQSIKVVRAGGFAAKRGLPAAAIEGSGGIPTSL
jgi:hypothetical protein